jgi:hypothetical protein
MSDEDRIERVRAVLFEDWDPVGCAPFLPRDEYDSYIPSIVQLLENHCTADELEAHLIDLEKHWFGEEQEGEKARLAAKNLIACWNTK